MGRIFRVISHRQVCQEGMSWYEQPDIYEYDMSANSWTYMERPEDLPPFGGTGAGKYLCFYDSALVSLLHADTKSVMKLEMPRSWGKCIAAALVSYDSDRNSHHLYVVSVDLRVAGYSIERDKWLHNLMAMPPGMGDFNLVIGVQSSMCPLVVENRRLYSICTGVGSSRCVCEFDLKTRCWKRWFYFEDTRGWRSSLAVHKGDVYLVDGGEKDNQMWIRQPDLASTVMILPGKACGRMPEDARTCNLHDLVARGKVGKIPLHESLAVEHETHDFPYPLPMVVVGDDLYVAGRYNGSFARCNLQTKQWHVLQEFPDTDKMFRPGKEGSYDKDKLMVIL